jgi:hypothetical protein
MDTTRNKGETIMDEQTRKQLQTLMPALKSLQQSVDRAYHTTMYQGVGKMAVRTYSVLHTKIASLLPDDVYVSEALRLDVTEEDAEKVQVAQVSLATGQLYNYLKNLLSEADPWLKQDEFREIKDMGRDLQERILNQTRSALRRALAGLDDVPPTPPAPPAPPAPPSVVSPAPPPPPARPAAPPPPRGAIRIEIEDDERKNDNFDII